MANKDIVSKSIDLIRFPLIVGVLFIHNQMKGEIVISGKTIPFPDAAWYEAIINLFSYVLPSIAVPSFFIISGYLFFKEGMCNKSLYLSKLKKRFWSLAVPYLLWNTLGILLFLVVRIPALHFIFPNASLDDITVGKILSCYWSDGYGFPADFPLWYVRELMIMVILSPILYYAIKKFGIYALLPLFICMLFQWMPTVISATFSAVFFFSLGIFFRLYPSMLEHVAKSKLMAIYILLAMTDLYTVTCGLSINRTIHFFTIFLGIAVLFNHAFNYVGKYGNKKGLFGEETFFIFASHGLFMPYFIKVLMLVINPVQEFTFLSLYFFVPVLSIAISILTYRIMKRTMPNLLSLLNGRR